MELKFSDKAGMFGANIFNVLNEKRFELIEQGRKVYNFSVGTPDFPPAPHIMEAAVKAAADPENYKYSLRDTPELKDAVVRWYRRRYGVELKHDEIMSVYGSQEGIAHIALAMCNAGDVVLVPNPCYPIFEIGPLFSGAAAEYYTLDENNGYLPDLDSIPEETAEKAKMMVVSFPANPVCKTAPREFYEKLIDFANKYNILIVHDNAYSEIIYDGREGISFLSIPGAKEVGVEFNSLSKTYNLSGIRISFLMGNSEVIKNFNKLRTQIDYGASHIVQKTAIAALDGPQDAVIRQREEYQRRRDALCGGFRSIGWNVPDSEGTMFAWAPLTKGFDNSVQFCLELMDKTGVICTPGSSFGTLGEGHVRFALVLPVEVIAEAVEKVRQSGIIK